MKISSRVYRGIEYIQLGDLPEDQQREVIEALGHSFIKILIEKNIVGNCIQYKDYEGWFENNYATGNNIIEMDRSVSSSSLLNVILDKA